MSAFDRITEMAMRRFAELERNPAYKMLQRQMEEEQRNPGLRMAREMAQRQIEEEQRNPGLRILRERLEQERNNPFLRIARERFNEASKFQGLYDLSNRTLEQFSRYAINDRLRDWERKIPDWILGPRSPTSSAFESMISHFGEAQRVAQRFAEQNIDLRALDRSHGLDRFAVLGRELSRVGRSAPPELSNTFLFGAAERLNRIQHVAEVRDAALLDQEFESFIDYILSWIKGLSSKILRRDVVLAILVPVVIAALQQAQSYKWRLDDKDDAARSSEEQNTKLNALLRALKELEKKAEPRALGKPYEIVRTTPTFARPGARRLRIGFVYKGQPVLAIASTGRWILIEYTDPLNLESRAGWIRKKYAKQQTGEAIYTGSDNKLRLLLATTSYEHGELSLGQAAELAGLSKQDFIDILGDQGIPILNYSAEELREELGV